MLTGRMKKNFQAVVNVAHLVLVYVLLLAVVITVAKLIGDSFLLITYFIILVININVYNTLVIQIQNLNTLIIIAVKDHYFHVFVVMSVVVFYVKMNSDFILTII